MKYSAENWKKFGERVAVIRRAAGFHDMKVWAAAVERSTRMMQGLERGEPVGDKTLAAIARVIDVPVGDLYDILLNPVGPSQQDDFVASPGAQVEAEATNDAVLREIRAMRREQREMSERLARLEQQGAQPLGGTSGPV